MSYLGLIAWGIFGVFGTDPPSKVDPANAVTPEICWSQTVWIEDPQKSDPAKNPKAIARAIAGHVILATGSNGWRGRSFANRMADKVTGENVRGQYSEVQFFICDDNGKPNYERNDPDLEYGIDLGLQFRRTGGQR